MLLTFAGAALAMALTPGPNMAYLLSRSICQGRTAGMISLAGVLAGFNQRNRQFDHRLYRRLDRRVPEDAPSWARLQRWLMGTVLGLLAARLAAESQT